jgi:anoctamin-10/anoctamin-7
MVGLRWGTVDFEEDEPERPQFHGTIIKSYIDGTDIKYFPPTKKSFLIAQSVTSVASLILLVIGCVTSIYILRFHLYSSIGSNASIVASAINSVQITILNMVYGIVATHLTQRENHRTDTEYEDSLIAKTFVFQFVNSYASFYYLAFIAPYLPRPPQLSDTGVEGGFVGECGFDDCMKPLALNLGIIFGTALTVNNLIEIASPLIMNRMKAKSEAKGTDAADMTPPEREYLLLPYDVMTENMKDYAEVAVQYGYMTIFIVCLPISCFISLINNYIEIKVDGWKLLSVFQRPIPKAAEDIGNWQAVFSVISIVAIVTNGGLICFTMSVLEDFDISTRVWIFFAFQWAMILSQQAIAYLIPDEPSDFITQRMRTRFLVSKVIDRVPDEPDDEDIMGNEDEAAAGKPHYQAYNVALNTYPKEAVSERFVELHVR